MNSKPGQTPLKSFLVCTLCLSLKVLCRTLWTIKFPYQEGFILKKLIILKSSKETSKNPLYTNWVSVRYKRQIIAHYFPINMQQLSWD